mmetsp:Transcript_54157/g.118100  ORF Transcript_54157/g.118100 Transcript_54157/m.118100 type:complete len:213 (-) Transcript_54157:68-706(-)
MVSLRKGMLTKDEWGRKVYSPEVHLHTERRCLPARRVRHCRHGILLNRHPQLGAGQKLNLAVIDGGEVELREPVRVLSFSLLCFGCLHRGLLRCARAHLGLDVRRVARLCSCQQLHSCVVPFRRTRSSALARALRVRAQLRSSADCAQKSISTDCFLHILCEPHGECGLPLRGLLFEHFLLSRLARIRCCCARHSCRSHSHARAVARSSCCR